MIKAFLVAAVAGFALATTVAAALADDAAAEAAKEEANRTLVIGAYQALFGDHDLSVLDRDFTEGYIQHNPQAATGREGLRQALKAWGIEAMPKSTIKVLRSAADGDLVWLYTVANFGSGDLAVVDIFRVENGKIAEHWDVIQPIPDKTASGNSMTGDGK